MVCTKQRQLGYFARRLDVNGSKMATYYRNIESK